MLGKNIETDHLATQCMNAFGKSKPDTSEPDDADRHIGQMLDRYHFPVRPPSLPDLLVGLANLAGNGKHHGQRMVGHFGSAVIGHIANLHTMPGSRFKIDIVDPVAITDHHLQFRERCKHLFRKRRALVACGNRSLTIGNQVILGLALK